MAPISKGADGYFPARMDAAIEKALHAEHAGLLINGVLMTMRRLP